MKPFKLAQGLILFMLVFIAIWVVINVACKPPETQVNFKNGYADISAYNIEERIVVIKNGYEFYPEKLFTPSDFKLGNVISPQEFTEDDSRNNQFGTFRAMLTVVPGKTYTLFRPSTDFADRVFIDGADAVRSGVVGDSAENVVPRISQEYYSFTSQDDKVEIIIQGANFVHAQGLIPPGLSFSTTANIAQRQNILMLTRLVFVCCMLTGFLYHIGIFLFNPRQKVSLYFSLACLMLVLREYWIIPLMFPDYNWYAAIRLEYLMFYGIAVAFCLFFSALFKGLLNKKVRCLFYCMSALYATLTLLLPTRIFSGLLIYYQALSGLLALYIIWKIAPPALRKGGSFESRLSFAGICVFVVTAALESLSHYNIRFFAESNVSIIGMMFFMFIYMIVLATDAAQTELNLAHASLEKQKLAADNDRLAEMNKLKTEFVSNVTHELKTPLAVVRGYAQLSGALLSSETPSPEEIKTNMKLIASEAERMAMMVTQLLDVGKIEENKMAWNFDRLDVAELVRHTISVYYPILNKNSNTLTIALPDTLPPVLADSARLEQVLVNLVSNAIRHTRDGKITISADADDNEVTITVQDNGSGIPPQILPHLFERYSNADGVFDSTGLGLFICKRILDAHGGRIWADTGKSGTAVHFTLPLYDSL